MSTIDVKELFNAGLSYGYRRARRHSSTAPFVHGQKGGLDVIDLEKTALQLTKASDAVEKVASTGRKVLFVGGKNEVRQVVKMAAEKADQPFVTGRWIGGTLTNFPQIAKRLKRLASLIEGKEKGGWDKYTKLERLMLDRERAKLELMFGGIAEMKELPGLVVVVDPRHDDTAVREANKIGIPVVALANTDCDITEITHPIVGNDSTVSAVKYVLNVLVVAVDRGISQKSTSAPKPESK